MVAVVESARFTNFQVTRAVAVYFQECFPVKEEFREDGFTNQHVRVKNKIRNNTIYLPVTVQKTNVTKMEFRRA